MSGRRQMTALMIMGLLLAAAPVRAEEDDADLQKVKQSQEDLKTEVAGLRKDMENLQKDIKTILTEIQALKKMRAQPRQQQPRARRTRPAQELLGKPAPEHTFKSFKDEELKLGGKSDNVKVVMFYASWCGYCKRSLPGFERLHDEYKDKDVQIMAVSLDDRTGRRGKTAEQLIEHYNSLNLSFPMHMDPDKNIGRDYKVTSFPTSFVVGKDGLIQAVHIGGPVDLDKQIQKEIDTLLGGKSLVQKDKETAKQS